MKKNASDEIKKEELLSLDDQDKLTKDLDFVAGILDLLNIGLSSGEAQSMDKTFISNVVFQAGEKLGEARELINNTLVNKAEVEA
ncbi:MAG: hypothetical protein A4E71_01555 [Smithella sp. PtaU1.Bin162]|nr:MAG: hypothetical protein A4E71_01555 [Smithella sp. PtaU1.Bin162]